MYPLNSQKKRNIFLQESGMLGSDLMTLGSEDILIFYQGVMQMGNLFLEWNSCGIHVGSTITINVNPQELKLELFKSPDSLTLQETSTLTYKVINK